MKRVLIINADDLGYTRGVNASIFRCHEAGALSSTTIMANGDAFQDAVQSVRAHPRLGVGVHLVLTELEPTASPLQIPDLLDDRGKLPPSPGKLLKALLMRRVWVESIRRELYAQLSRVLDSGISPTHLDTHKHVHLIPQVLDVVLDLAHLFGIRWIRSPFDESPFFPLVGSLPSERRMTFVKQHATAGASRVFRRSFQEKVRRAGLLTPDSFFGVSTTGLWSPSVLRCLMDSIPDGITEWMLHPGDHDDDLGRKPTRLLHQREEERDMLLSPYLRQALQERGVLLQHFGEELPG